MYTTAFITSFLFLGGYAKARQLSRETTTTIKLEDTVVELNYANNNINKRVAAIFDVDGTLYRVPGDSTGAATAVVTLFWITRASSIIKFSLVVFCIPILLVLLYCLDKTDRTLSMFLMSNLQLVGVQTSTIQKCMDQFVSSNEFQAMINKTAVKRLNEHLARGDLVVLISATPNLVTGPIAKFFQANIACGSKCVIENDIVTRGQYQNTLLIGHAKEQLVSEILVKRYNINLENSYAYGDHITDLPVLNMVGNPVAVNPTNKLEVVAIQKNWEILLEEKSTSTENPKKESSLLHELIFITNNALFPSTTDTNDVSDDNKERAEETTRGLSKL